MKTVCKPLSALPDVWDLPCSWEDPAAVPKGKCSSALSSSSSHKPRWRGGHWSCLPSAGPKNVHQRSLPPKIYVCMSYIIASSPLCPILRVFFIFKESTGFFSLNTYYIPEPSHTLTHQVLATCVKWEAHEPHFRDEDKEAHRGHTFKVVQAQAPLSPDCFQ